MTKKYDSTEDTLKHIDMVKKFMIEIILLLSKFCIPTKIIIFLPLKDNAFW